MEPHRTLPAENGFFVAESASAIGQVTLHAHSSIWFDAVLCGDIEPIEIEPRSNIQDNSVVHTSGNVPVTIGTGVTVGHPVRNLIYMLFDKDTTINLQEATLNEWSSEAHAGTAL